MVGGHDPFLLGLTGSIGMGKSTVSSMFQAEGVPVFDADQAVHKLYAAGGAAVPLISELFSDAIADQAVDRKRLSKLVVGNKEALKRLEGIVHPLVAAERRKWLSQQRYSPVLLLDIPLLFETGAEAMVDAVAVVSAPADIQEQRVLSRPGMTREILASILERQVPDDQKRRRADFIIYTGLSIEETHEHVRALLKGLRGRQGSAYSRHFTGDTAGDTAGSPSKESV